MTTAYTSLLGLALPVTGELSGTWGDTVNDSITSLLDTAVAGTTNVSADSNVTLTTTTGASNQARQAILLFSGARTAIRTVTAPAQSKVYTVINATTGGFAVQLVGAGPTTGVTIANGARTVVAWNGSDFVEVSSPSSIILPGGTANGVLYLNGSKVVTSGSALTFDGTNFANTGNITAGTTSSGANVVAYSSSYGSNGLLRVFGTDGNNKGAFGASSATTVTLNARTGVSMIFEANDAEQMRLTSTGLSIGTTSSSYKLQTSSGSTANNAYFASTATTAYTPSAYNGDKARLFFAGGNGTGSTNGIEFTTGGSNECYFGTVQESNGSGAFVWQGYYQPTSVYFERMRLDSSGNLGLGVTPSAWGSSYKAIDSNTRGLSLAGGTDSAAITVNAYNNVGWKYAGTSSYKPVLLDMFDGSFKFNIATASGTAGNAITFTQAMTLDASGNLGVGTTSPLGRFNASSTSGNVIVLDSLKTTSGAADTGPGIEFIGYDGAAPRTQGVIGAYKENGTSGNYASYMAFSTRANGGSITERARIDSSGNFMVGTTTPTANCKLTVTGAGISIAGGRGSTFALAYADWSIYNTSSGNALAFDNGSERVRIDSSGRLLVGTTTSSFGSRITSFNDSSYTFESQRTTTASEGHIAFTNANGAVGSIFTSGTTTSFNTSSDYRLKNITGPITNSGAYIDSLNPVEGTWKADGATFVGLIAHEAQEASRTVVATGVKDGEEMQGMDYSSAEIIANLIAEVQSLRKRLADAGIA